MQPQLSSLDLLSIGTALGAGLISFASPCVLPLVPGYLGYITGLSAEELRGNQADARATVLLNGGAFVLGLAVIFALLGASASLLGETLGHNLLLLTRIGGVLVVVLGLHMLGVIRIPLLYRTARVSDATPQQGAGPLGALVLGLAFGAGWTPCVGPILAGLLTMASSAATVGQGTLLLLVYALGLGLPFILAGLAVDRSLALMRRIRPHLHSVEMASGVLLVGMGALLLTERFTLISAMMVKVFGMGLAQ